MIVETLKRGLKEIKIPLKEDPRFNSELYRDKLHKMIHALLKPYEIIFSGCDYELDSVHHYECLFETKGGDSQCLTFKKQRGSEKITYQLTTDSAKVSGKQIAGKKSENAPIKEKLFLGKSLKTPFANGLQFPAQTHGEKQLLELLLKTSAFLSFSIGTPVSEKQIIPMKRKMLFFVKKATLLTEKIKEPPPNPRASKDTPYTRHHKGRRITYPLGYGGGLPPSLRKTLRRLGKQAK